MFENSEYTGAHARAVEQSLIIPSDLGEKIDSLLTKTDTVDNFVDTEVAAIKTETDKIAATITKIDAEIIKTALIKSKTDLLVQRTTAKKTAATPVTQDLFTITGGSVKLTSLVGLITTVIAAGANNAKLVFTPTGGSAVDLCAVVDIASGAVGKFLTITGVKANAMALSADAGVCVNAVAMAPIILAPGVISLNCSAGTTGVIDFYIGFESLAPDVIIAATVAA